MLQLSFHNYNYQRAVENPPVEMLSGKPPKQSSASVLLAFRVITTFPPNRVIEIEVAAGHGGSTIDGDALNICCRSNRNFLY